MSIVPTLDQKYQSALEEREFYKMQANTLASKLAVVEKELASRPSDVANGWRKERDQLLAENRQLKKNLEYADETIIKLREELEAYELSSRGWP